MFRVDIKKDGSVTNFSSFDTVPDCEAWISENYNYFPEGFQAQIIDISQVIKKQKRLAQAKKRIDFGAEIISEIIAINEERLELGTMTELQFQAMLSDPILFKVERLLWNGSIMSAKTLIQSMNDEHYNSNQKEFILDKINAFLISINEEG